MQKRNISLIYIFVISMVVIIGLLIYKHICKVTTEFNSEEVYAEYLEINKKACDIEEAYVLDGYIRIDDIPNILDKMEEFALESIEGGYISSYDKQDVSIYFELNSGVGYLYVPKTNELMSGDEVGKILTIEPYARDYDFLINSLLLQKSPDLSAKEIVNALPDKYVFNESNNLDWFFVDGDEKLSGNKIILWYGHGGYTDRTGSVLGTSVPVSGDKIEKYKAELLNDELVLGRNCFCVTPAYFEKHIEEQELEGCMIYLNACESARDNRLANVFINKGASLVIGNTKTVHIQYMLNMMSDFMSGLTQQYDDATYWTAEDALLYAKKQNGERDSSGYGAEVKLIYPEKQKEFQLLKWDGYGDGFSKEEIKEHSHIAGVIDETIEDLVQEISRHELVEIIYDDGYEPICFEGHTYKLFTDKKEWHEAKKHCESLGGYLATIGDEVENKVLYSYITSLGCYSAYLGLSDEEMEGTWTWVTGGKVEYTNWAQFEPNAESSNEDYGMFYTKYRDGTWNDGTGDRQAYICEWDEPLVNWEYIP